MTPLHTAPQHLPSALHSAVPFGALARGAGADERQQRRARANWSARLIDAAAVINVGRVCDVSEGGFGIMSAVHMPVGALIEVALAVPKGDGTARSTPVRCKVRVASCAFAGAQSRLGVQFIALPMAARLAIRKYVLSHC